MDEVTGETDPLTNEKQADNSSDSVKDKTENSADTDKEVTEEKKDKDIEEKTSDNDSGTDNNNGKQDSELKLGRDVDIIDNTECKFNVNSFKLVYVINSESFLYKRMALKRAKEVSILM